MNHTDSQDMRERIMAEATRLFAASGYHGISMREIAQAVNVSKAGLYYHFKDKEDLFLSILLTNIDHLHTIIQQARQESTTRTQIRRMIEGIFAQEPWQQMIMQVAHQDLTHIKPEQQAHFQRLYHEKFVSQVEALLQDGIARGELQPVDTHLTAWVLLGMIYPFVNASHRHSDQSVAQAMDLIVRLFFDGAAAAT